MKLCHKILESDNNNLKCDYSSPEIFYNELGILKENQEPIIFSPKYFLSSRPRGYYTPNDAMGMVIFEKLIQQKLISPESIVEPKLPSKSHLLITHDNDYLSEILLNEKTYRDWAGLGDKKIKELKENDFEEWMNSLLLQVSGSILSVHLAIQRGFCFHLGGGRHHCSYNCPGWFCFFSDITIMIAHARKAYPEKIKKVLVIDLDTHQGNGYEIDKLHFKDNDLIIIDFYNRLKYPNSNSTKNSFEKEAINYNVPLTKSSSNDDNYLNLLKTTLSQAIDDHPDISLIIYNNGADILKNDSFKADLSITSNGLKKRDLIISDFVLNKKIPFSMLISGGYGKSSFHSISESFCQMFQKFKEKEK